MRAAEIGREAGLRFVYAGNLPGQVGEYEDTFCPACNFRVVKRRGYIIQEYRLSSDGNCPECGQKIPGFWHKNPSRVVLNGSGMPISVY
jgi:pyruvate formate lyase activating enzyme